MILNLHNIWDSGQTGYNKLVHLTTCMSVHIHSELCLAHLSESSLRLAT